MIVGFGDPEGQFMNSTARSFSRLIRSFRALPFFTRTTKSASVPGFTDWK